MSLIVCLILILGVSRLFVWMNSALVKRQQDFQATRIMDQDDPPEKRYNADFHTPDKLDILR